MASIKDVAHKAGVSISTVSNAIRGTKYVSEDLQAKIFQAVEELNYEVNSVASSLKSKATMSIGVIITNISRLFFPQVIQGIQEISTNLGYNLTFCDTKDSLEREQYFMRMLQSRWVDGVILDSVAAEDDFAYFEKLASFGTSRKKIPIVSLERNLAANKLDCVVVDNYQGGRVATQHLVDCGCRKIAHISGPLISCMVQSRLQGFKEVLAENNIPLNDLQMIGQGDFSPISAYRIVKTMLVEGIDIDGLFAANDQMAIGAMKALKEHGYRIPDDVKVVGFDNTFVSSIISPSLTTVNIPKYRMGVEAMEQLSRRIATPDCQIRAIELPIKLIVRQSTERQGENSWDLYGW